MSERFLVSEAGVDVFASQEDPKRITILDGELTQGKAGEITAPSFLVADRALVQLDSLQPFSVQPAPKARSAPSKPKAASRPRKQKAPPKRGSRSKASAKR